MVVGFFPMVYAYPPEERSAESNADLEDIVSVFIVD
jgi:hypothetical protein